MVDFKNYKRNRMDAETLTKEAEKASSGRKNEVDARFWVPTRGKDGNGYAIIRFLPGIEENGLPWVQYWDHAFKGPTGQWYIEKSLTTLGQNDPLSELNQKMWNESAEGSAERKLVSSRKRNMHYVSNVLVIEDKNNPANEGKVFLYRYGKKIHDKLLAAMKPKFADIKPLIPFDLYEGADFVLRITSERVGDKMLPKYDDSSFKEAAPLLGGDDSKIEKVFNAQYVMYEFIDPVNYKSYDELKVQLARALGDTAPRTVRQEVALDAKQEPRQPKTAESTALPGEESDDEDDTMALFSKLVNG